HQDTTFTYPIAVAHTTSRDSPERKPGLHCPCHSQPPKKVKEPTVTKKRIITIALALFVLIIAAVVVTVIYRSDRTESTPLTFVTSPKEIHVMINGEDHGTVESGETITVLLGPEATIQLSQEGFTPYDEYLDIEQGQDHLVTAEL